MGGLGGADDHGFKAGRLIRFQLADGHQPGAVLVGSGEVGDEVVDALDAEPRQLFGPGGADPGQSSNGRKQIHGNASFPEHYTEFFSRKQGHALAGAAEV